MSIGAGIAIAGAWIFAGMLGLSNTMTGYGVLIGMLCAAIVTACLA